LFVHSSELALVVGLPPALVDRALPLVTVFNATTGVDPSIASPEIVAALPHRNVAQDQPSDTLATAPSANNLPAGGDSSAAPTTDPPTAKSTNYRVLAVIDFQNGRHAASEAVIALGDKSEPYRVLSWQDDVASRDVTKRRGH
jgi:general secretion pathway protein K